MAICASYFAEMDFFFYKHLEGEFYIVTTHKSCFYIKMSKTIQKPNGMKDIYFSVLGFNYPLPEVSENWGRVTEILNATYPLVSEFCLGCTSEFQL